VGPVSCKVLGVWYVMRNVGLYGQVRQLSSCWKQPLQRLSSHRRESESGFHPVLRHQPDPYLPSVDGDPQIVPIPSREAGGFWIPLDQMTWTTP
jgi:hypothetical protein